MKKTGPTSRFEKAEVLLATMALIVAITYVIASLLGCSAESFTELIEVSVVDDTDTLKTDGKKAPAWETHSFKRCPVLMDS